MCRNFFIAFFAKDDKLNVNRIYKLTNETFTAEGLKLCHLHVVYRG